MLRVEVEGQGGLFRVSMRGYARSGGGLRGPIRGFSRASRRRCLETAARLSREAEALFMDFTYKDPVPSMREVERDRLALVKRLERRYPGASFMWVKGVESTRGARVYNPHQNVVAFGVGGNYIAHDWLADQWSEVTEGAGWCWVERVSGRRVSRYLARYLATAKVGASLDYSTYLTADDWVGRFWGVVNREAIPWAELVKVVLRPGEWLYRVKRSARRVWGGVNKSRCRGFTLFVGEVAPWMSLPGYFGAVGPQCG